MAPSRHRIFMDCYRSGSDEAWQARCTCNWATAPLDKRATVDRLVRDHLKRTRVTFPRLRQVHQSLKQTRADIRYLRGH